MARRKRKAAEQARRRDAAKALPWAALAQVGFAIYTRWRALSAKDRERLSGLVRDSGGRLGNLSAKERKELRGLLGKLDLKGLGRELAALKRRGGRRRTRARRRCAH